MGKGIRFAAGARGRPGGECSKTVVRADGRETGHCQF